MECFSLVAVIKYGPSKRGINLAMRRLSWDLYSARRFAVERTTRPPTLNGKELDQCLFWKWDCEIFAVSKLSRASSSMGSIVWICAVAAATAGFASGSGLIRGGSICGDLPKRS